MPGTLRRGALRLVTEGGGGRHPGDAAEALADDLSRLLDGRPIAARPVGAVEQVMKWVRRNPVVSALTAV